jgi:hypothetical protein
MLAPAVSSKGENSMRFKLVLAVASIALAVPLLGASGASASTRIGDECVAAGGAATYSITQLNAPLGRLLPLTAPTAGVITSWGFNANVSGIEGLPYNMKLKVLRPTADPNVFGVVGESAREPVQNGSKSFATRIPVQAGDHLGTGGGDSFAVSLFCPPVDPSDSIGIAEGDTPVGSNQTFTPSGSARLALLASIEPDADNDGFGDETQDACPQAVTQVACPVVTLSATATASKKLVTVLLTGTTAANVTVNGKVSLGKGKKAKLKGGTKAVAPGAFTKFKLKFTAKLIKRLKELPPIKKLTLKITSTAPNLAATPTKKVIKVKLKGQGQQS